MARPPAKRLPSPRVSIRVASVLFGGLMLGHLSGYPWTSAHIAEQARLVGAMKATDFVFAGERQTYWGLYFGWGVLVAALLLSMAVMLWLMSGLTRIAPRQVGAVTGVVSATCLAGSFISLRFFYAPPTAFFAVLSAILLVATVQLVRAGRETADQG